LQPYDVRCTVYITTGYVDQPGWIRLCELRELHTAGWEIGAHTMNHPHLSRLSDFMIHREFWGAKQQLQAWGFEPKSMATPYLDTSPEIQAIIPLYYQSNRNGRHGDGQLPINVYDLELLDSLTHDVPLLKAWLDHLEINDRWGIFLGHYVDERGITASELLELALYARSIGVAILPVSEALERLSVIRRPWRSKGGANMPPGPSQGSEP
jgi:peptidoglycan/xylan/chitin deacetylase (PgdA/CDA1 family)